MIAPSHISQFMSGFHGQVLTRGDPDYDTARKVFNAMIDRRPDVIAQCATSGDVTQAINFARQQGVPISVRGTGHNVAGYAVCNDGVVIDLSPMKNIHCLVI